MIEKMRKTLEVTQQLLRNLDGKNDINRKELTFAQINNDF